METVRDFIFGASKVTALDFPGGFMGASWGLHGGLPGGSEVKESACNAGDLGSIPGSGRFPWRRKWQPTPVFLPGESHGRRSLVGYTVHRVAKSRTSLVGYTVHRVAESDTTERLHFHFLSKSLQMVTAAMKLKDTPWKKSYDQPRQHVKKQSCYFTNKGLSSQSFGFSSSHVWIWELNCKESWVPKNWCFWTVVLEKTLESPLDCKEIQPVHPKGNQSWIFIGRTDVEAETPIIWPPDEKNRLIGKDPDVGEEWRQEKGMIEDEMVGSHHQHDGHEFE